jgi:hypothetical protein
LRNSRRPIFLRAARDRVKVDFKFAFTHPDIRKRHIRVDGWIVLKGIPSVFYSWKSIYSLNFCDGVI